MAATQYDSASEGRRCEWCCWCFAPTASRNSARLHEPAAAVAAINLAAPQPSSMAATHEYNTASERRRSCSVIKEWCCRCWCFPPTSAPRFSRREEQDLKDKLAQLTMNDLDALLLYIQAELNRLEPSSSNLVTRVLSECQKQTDVASCFVGTLPKNLTKEVSGASASFFLPLLKQVLGGMGGVHWAGLGLSCIAWSLGNMDRTSQNHENCLKLLRKVVSLLSNIRYLVGQQAGIQDDQHSMQDLEVSTEIALRCAIICSSSLNQAYLARFFKAAKVEELISAMEAELNDAKVTNIGIGVKAILEKMPKAHGPVTFTSRDDEGIVGGDEEMQTVFDYLMNKDGDVVAVCLHGMGGIGKSTRAFSVYKKFQAMGVYRCCMVALELGTESKELPTFQWMILQQVCKGEVAKFSGVEEGKQKMETEFPKVGGPIILYVDNVMEEGHLCELLPNSTYFPHGSKILITTRNKRVFNDFKELGIIKQYSECIEVEKLGKEAAEELFFRKVGRDSVGTQEEISTALNEVIELCDGLPLALKVVSGYIANMSMGRLDLWREVVQKMRDAEPLDGIAKDRLYSRLDFSIHQLDPRFKTAFLDIVVFAIGREWEFAERVGGMVELEGLFQRSLIQKRTLEDDVYDTVVVEVHDVLLAKGRQMASHDHSEIRITNQQDFLTNIGSNDLERNIVGLSNIEISGADLLQKMPSLRVLLDVAITVECLTARLPHLKAIHISQSSVPRPMDFSACSGLKELRLDFWRVDDFDLNDLEDVLFRVAGLEALRLECSSTSKWEEMRRCRQFLTI